MAEATVIPTDTTMNDLYRVFGRIGLLSFGGPAAQISLMHRELVEERPWLTEDEYLRALSFCMLLPGPEAMQLATYAGWRLRGVPGGLLAGLLFVLPGAFVVLALAVTYAFLGGVPLVCDDGDACNGVETCDATTGACLLGTPVLCGDGNACNGEETCDSATGVCVGGTPVTCDDGDPCHGTEPRDAATNLRELLIMLKQQEISILGSVAVSFFTITTFFSLITGGCLKPPIIISTRRSVG